ncbi:MAG: hypothetical protein IPH05_12555 [Flavobacteriales bacterium]|nr:hypothetical protein [Flavobacteriales bacterium]
MDASADAAHTIAEQASVQVIVRAWTDYTDQKNFANAKTNCRTSERGCGRSRFARAARFLANGDTPLD